jgi:CDP-6-deoxy-D-xylo-4-hexulose-3-dehydrase
LVGTRAYPLARPTYGVEEIDAVMATLRDGQTTCGPRVKAFEDAFAAYVGRRFAVMVNSGSSADLLVAHTLGPAQPGEEILVPAVTWPTQIWSCVMAGYTVRLVDVDPATLQMDGGDLKRKIGPRTRGVFLTHVLGNVGSLDDLPELTILEDCCEAMGARWRTQHVGTFGRAAAFSFFFSHVLNTMEGGMIVTDSEEDARSCRLWRSHGWEPRRDYRFWFPTWGMNVRPTEVQGAFGTVQMDRLDGFLNARAHNYTLLASIVTQFDQTLSTAQVLDDCEPAWHGFPVMVDQHAPFSREMLCDYLDEHGIETRPIVAGNIARQPAVIHDPRIVAGELPGADLIHRQGFYIGVPSFADIDGIGYVEDTVGVFMRAHGC